MASSEQFLTDGSRVAAWIEGTLCHTKGRFAGKPFVLEPFQREFVDELFRVNAETGLRVYSEATLMIPRKNGKSSLAAALALYMLIAEDEAAPEVYVAANSRDQAQMVFRTAKTMVEDSVELQNWVKPMRYHLEAPSCNGLMRSLAADARMNHGSNPSCSILDELWAAKTSDLLVALTSGTGAREQPLTVVISTTGHDKKSPLGEIHQAFFDLSDDAKEFRNDGFLSIGRDEENGVLFWLYGPPIDSEWRYSVDLDDPSVWKKCNPASWITEEYLRRQHDKPAVRQSEFQRFHLNVWAENEEYWLPVSAWANCREGYEPIEDGARITVGVDLGQKRDRSAVVICRRREVDNEYHFDVEATVFDPPVDPTQNFDIGTLRAHLRNLARQYNIERLAFDPWRLEETGQMLEDEGIGPMIRFDMGWARTGPATESLYEAIVSKRVHHNGDPVLASHVAAGAITENERGSFRLTKRKATEPIDALMALMMAHAESMAETGAGVNSVYENRDLLIL